MNYSASTRTALPTVEHNQIPKPTRKFGQALLARLVIALGRSYRLLSGCGRLANTRLLAGFTAMSGDQPVWALLRNGLHLLVFPQDFIGRAVYVFGDLDPKVTLVCKKLLRPGDTFLDIGANVGLVTHYSAPLVGKSGVVHAFEPQPAVFELLSKSTKRNELSQVSLHAYALGRTDESARMTIPEGNAGAGSLSLTNRHGKEIDIAVRNTDTVLAELNVGHVRLVKMDVEGFEEEVLKGARRFLRENPPDAILFEVLGDTPFFEREISSFLDELGFAFFAIRPSLFKLDVSIFDESNQPDGSVHEVIAVPKGARYDEIGSLLGAIK